MIESRQPVRTYKAQAMCECGGELKFTFESLPMNPMKHIHQCNKCGERQNLLSVYPKMVYEESL